tara:strand:- start:488 stop:754 length:267 start_codon:yes stop_codon:yes gene_type:complete
VIKLFLEESNPEAILLDNLDQALIGHCKIKQTDSQVAVYSETKILQTLMKNNSWGYNQALNYFYQNVDCAYMGPNTPIIVSDLPSHTA